MWEAISKPKLERKKCTLSRYVQQSSSSRTLENLPSQFPRVSVFSPRPPRLYYVNRMDQVFIAINKNAFFTVLGIRGDSSSRTELSLLLRLAIRTVLYMHNGRERTTTITRHTPPSRWRIQGKGGEKVRKKIPWKTSFWRRRRGILHIEKVMFLIVGKK